MALYPDGRPPLLGKYVRPLWVGIRGTGTSSCSPMGPSVRPELQDDGTNNVDLDLAPLIERIAPRRAAAPASPYEVDVVRCRECRAETRYFTWDGVEPPDPRPETVRLVGSPPRSASPPGLLPVILPASPGSWQNQCLHCDASLER